MNKNKFLPPIRISCGHQSTVAVNDSGQIFVWGDNKAGKLGLKFEDDIVWRPSLLNLPQNGFVNQVCCGAEFIACVVNGGVDEAGVLVTWGVNDFAQLGFEGEANGFVVVEMSERVARVSCGNDFVACVSELGHLFTWGRGSFGNLGHGNTESVSRPQIVQALVEQKILNVSCGSKHMLAVTNNFKIYSWGNGAHGRLGHNSISGTSTPKLVESLKSEKILQITAGDSHSIAISVLGVTYSWGCGTYGRLGQGSEVDLYVPTVISSLKGKRVYMVSCGFRHCVGLTIHGEVYVWGSGNYGVCGVMDLKDLRNLLVPMKVMYLEGRKATQVACGTWHSVVITSAGEVFTWGYHGHGRLGLGSGERTDQAFPKQIPSNWIFGVTGGSKVVERISEVSNSAQVFKSNSSRDSWKLVQVACGAQFSLALSRSGTIWVWGEGKNGALGNGQSTDDQLFPMICTSLNSVKILFVSCGSAHCLAISENDVYSWGSGKYGQLGTGFLSISPLPRAIPLLQNKNSIFSSCGGDFSAVLTASKELYTFGNGESGKLGHNSDSKQVFPKLVQSLINITQVSAGLSHTACLDINFTIYTCGSGAYGKLANGSLENLKIFQKIHSKSGRKYKSVSCGGYHTLLLDEDGELFAAGKKEVIGSKYDEIEAKVVEKLRGKRVRSISAAEEHSVILMENGDCLAWGIGKYGKVGVNGEIGLVVEPSKVGLPGNVVQVACKINHNLALLESGEVYVWGCGSGGRLGTGNTLNLKIPKQLETKWTLLGTNINEEEQANNLDLIISQLPTGVRFSSLNEAMLILQHEPEEYYIEHIIRTQNSISSKFSSILSSLESSKNTESESLSLINEFESKVLQRTFELNLPQRDYLKVHIPGYLASKLPEVEKLIWTLQQQPCYLSRLVTTMFSRGAKDLQQIIKSIKTIFSGFSDFDKSRESLLFISLLKQIISLEIENVNKVDELFSASGSLCSQFLGTFFSREYGSDLFSRIFKDNVKQCLDIIEAVGADGFVINIKELAKKGYKGSDYTMIKDKKLKLTLDDSVLYTTRAVGKFIESFKSFPGVLPNSLKVLLKHTFSKIVSKVWLGEVYEGINEKILKALLRLLIVQIMIPELISPETEGLIHRSLSEAEREVFGFFSEILKKVVNNTVYVGDHYSALNDFIKTSHETLIKSLETCLETDDSSEVDLVVSIFLSHFSKHDNFVHFPVNDLIFLLVTLIKYKKTIELHKTNDEVFELLTQIGDVGSLVITTLENYKVNLKLSSKFLAEPNNVMICSICGVPMAKNLALKGALNESIIRPISADPSGYIDYVELALRKIPSFHCTDTQELTGNLRKYIDVLGPNPNYKLLFDLRVADEKIAELGARGYLMQDLVFELSVRACERHRVREYLKKMSDGVLVIESKFEEYLRYLVGKTEDLRESIDNVKYFRTSLGPSEDEAKKMAFFKLKKIHLSKLKKTNLNNLPFDLEHKIVGDIEVELLIKYGVIEKLSYSFQSTVVPYLFIHYSNDPESGWRFELIYSKGSTKDLISHFTFSNQYFLEIRRTANSESKLEIPKVGTFKLGPLMLFLNSKIREQVI